MQKKIVVVVCCLFIIGCFGDIRKSNTEVKKPVKVGGEIPQDPNDPLYREMAEEVLKIYLRLEDISRPHHVVQVEKVTVETVAGSLTRINFVAAPNCLVSEDPKCEKDLPVDLKCSSETWEQIWLSKVSIKVLCDQV
ncbi:unnamed protein product [Euphydryas editha]|uniref:Cystatin domain-containing protein n=1 Tax=Euphydryas editha TaxID=104508 RepID=A0AAU9U984_EUPED|nr:unnamed protein product [Euphydryas editha]